MSKPVAWSYSVLDSFETCPKRHYLTKVVKTVSDPPSDAMAWGNAVHKALELRIKNQVPLPENCKQYEPLAAAMLKKAEGGVIEAEQKMALSRDYRPVTYFAKDVWVRGITDVTIVKGEKAFIGDWKTGAPKPNSEQLQLTAAMTMHHKPWVKTVINAFVWLKDGSVTQETFTRDDLPTIWQGFAPRVQRLEIAFADEKWPAKPSGLCNKWCPVPKSMCQYSGKDG